MAGWNIKKAFSLETKDDIWQHTWPKDIIPSSPAKNDTGMCLKLWHTLNSLLYHKFTPQKHSTTCSNPFPLIFNIPKPSFFVEILHIFGAVNEDAQDMVREGTRVKCTSDWWCHLSMDWWWQHDGTPQAIWCTVIKHMVKTTWKLPVKISHWPIDLQISTVGVADFPDLVKPGSQIAWSSTLFNRWLPSGKLK